PVSTWRRSVSNRRVNLCESIVYFSLAALAESQRLQAGHEIAATLIIGRGCDGFLRRLLVNFCRAAHNNSGSGCNVRSLRNRLRQLVLDFKFITSNVSCFCNQHLVVSVAMFGESICNDLLCATQTDSFQRGSQSGNNRVLQRGEETTINALCSRSQSGFVAATEFVSVALGFFTNFRSFRFDCALNFSLHIISNLHGGLDFLKTHLFQSSSNAVFGGQCFESACESAIAENVFLFGRGRGCLSKRQTVIESQPSLIALDATGEGKFYVFSGHFVTGDGDKRSSHRNHFLFLAENTTALVFDAARRKAQRQFVVFIFVVFIRLFVGIIFLGFIFVIVFEIFIFIVFVGLVVIGSSGKVGRFDQAHGSFRAEQRRVVAAKNVHYVTRFRRGSKVMCVNGAAVLGGSQSSYSLRLVVFFRLRSSNTTINVVLQRLVGNNHYAVAFSGERLDAAIQNATISVGHAFLRRGECEDYLLFFGLQVSVFQLL